VDLEKETASERSKDVPGSEEPETGAVVARVASVIEGGVRAAVKATARGWDERPGARARRLRRMARDPLPFLYEVHPGARRASPRELGIQTIPVDEIGGTAVGPPNQRSMDFLPLKPFRSPNWQDRWRRVRAATERLAVLPPIDVLRFADRYWVVDGHNRVAAALYTGQREIDADVVELILPDGVLSATPTSLANVLEEHSEIQAALSRRTVDDETPAQPGGPEPSRPSDGPSDGAPVDRR
jgi:hypothetical protein